jgi:hypothetical protein
LVGFVEGFGTTTEAHSYSFIDQKLPAGNRFLYRLKQIDNNGSFKYSEEYEVDITPDNFHLSQNYPNPFNPTTVISYQLPVTSHVTIKVYDILGKEAAILVNEEKPAGFYKNNFDATELATGIYFYSMQAGKFTSTKKLILLR